jgi:xanthine dehydrogenase accessory factor
LTACSLCRYPPLSSFDRIRWLFLLFGGRELGLKHWQEMADILDRVVELGRQGRATALAMVTQISGSAYRRPGAKLLVDAGGGFLGGVSGGCLEEDVREIGIGVLQSGTNRVLHYDTGTDETKLWGLGLGCDGEVDILVQPIPVASAVEPGGTWARVRALLDGDVPFAVATMVEEGQPSGTIVVGVGGRLAGALTNGAPGREPGPDGAALEAEVVRIAAAALDGGRSRLDTLGARRVFTDVLLPPPKLLVCGASDDARPTVALAATVGFRVFVADHRPAYLTQARYPAAQRLFLTRPEEEAPGLPADRDTFAVIKTHSLMRDTAWVKRLAATDLPFIGVLGPRARIQRIAAELGLTQDPRLFGPIGLDLGADGPEQVGLSIVAELLAVRARRSPRHLRERAESIHA